MAISSSSIEKRAVHEVESALLSCGTLAPDLKSNDKTLSWDGFVYVYTSEEQKKKNLIGRVPVQIKGRNAQCGKPTTSYPFSVADLNNYCNDMGCILFLVHEGKEKKIYFSSLPRSDLEPILDKFGDQQTRNIKFKEFPSDPEEIEHIFKSFLCETDYEDPPFTVIDKVFLENHQVRKDEANDLVAAFSSINSDPSLILKIVCNKLHIHTESYNRLVKEIYEEAIRSESPTFLMADGGTGKSTLLCSVAVYAYTVYGIRVLYSNHSLTQNSSPSKFVRRLKRLLSTAPGLTLLCIDESLKNQELIHTLYQESAYGRGKNKYFNNLRILIVDRPYGIKNLFFSQVHNFSLWTSRSPALLIENMEQNNPRSASDVDVLMNYFPRDHVKVLYFDREIRQTIIEKMIDRFSSLHSLDSECTKQAKQKIKLDQKTISDVLLDFRRNYNNAAEHAIRPVTKIDWDWDIWQNRLKQLNCQAAPAGMIPLKYTFRYVAALTVLHVSASVSFLEKMTGIALADELYELFPQDLAEPIGITQSGFLMLRHETVAANYFEINPHPSLTDCLKILMDRELFDEGTLIRFEKEVFSLSKIFCADSSEKEMDITELLHTFSRHDSFRKTLAKRNRLYSLELALIAADMASKRSALADSVSYCEEQLNASFEYTFSMLSSDNKPYAKVHLWGKYFSFAMRECQKVPSTLLRHLAYDNYFYKRITFYLQRMRQSMTVWLSQDQKQTLNSCLAEVFQWILDYIDKDDIPSKINLIQIYITQDEFEKAYKLITEIANAPSSRIKQDMVLLQIKNYAKKVKTLGKINRNDPRIKNLNSLIVELYESTLQRYPISSSMYITTTCSFARFRKDQSHFDEAYGLLDALLKSNPDNPIIYEAYIELGMLCNTKKFCNKYFDLKTSICYFNKALELLRASSNDSPKNELYILKPLAQTYISDFQYNSAIAVCNKILKHYPTLPDVTRMKDLALKFDKLPKDERPQNWWRLL